jgi:hypothetical protein
VDYPVPSADAWTKSADVWEAFKPWMWGEVGAGTQLTKRGFYAKLKQAPGVLYKKRDGIDGFRGFALRALDGSSSQKSTSGFSEADQMAIDLGI